MEARKLILIFLLAGCKKYDSPNKQSADVKTIYEGIWWSENYRDSLVIKFKKVEKDSVKYFTNNSIFDSQLTHKIGFEPTDDNLTLMDRSNIYSFRREH